MIRFLASIILTYCLFSCYHCGTLPAGQLAEQTLITSLLNTYNKNIRPNETVSVGITATLQQIVAIDEKQQIMTSSSFISQTWFDDRLSWTPSSSNDIEVVMLPVKSLWLPDTMVLNSADTSGYFTISDYSLASVSYEGQVYMILPALTIRTRCNLLVQKFPFDRQVCSINLTSWSQGSNRIVYTENGSIEIDLSEYTQHPIWELNGTDLVIFHAEDRAPFEYTYNDVISIQLYIQRKPLFFMMNGIFACIVLNCVTLLSYALPFATQIALCLTCFMTYSVYSLNFSSLFPQQSQYLMMITLFFLLSIGWTLISMTWFVICNYYAAKGEMPHSLYVFCGRLQRVLFCCFPSTKANVKTDKTKNAIIGNGELKKSGDKNIFAWYSRRRVGAGNTNTNHQNPVGNTQSIKPNSSDVNSLETPVFISIHETNGKEKPKCNFCDRCEPCQIDHDKDKAKGKSKKDIEGRCNALNYFVFTWVLIFMFISNLALWLVMAQ